MLKDENFEKYLLNQTAYLNKQRKNYKASEINHILDNLQNKFQNPQQTHTQQSHSTKPQIVNPIYNQQIAENKYNTSKQNLYTKNSINNNNSIINVQQSPFQKLHTSVQNLRGNNIIQQKRKDNDLDEIEQFQKQEEIRRKLEKEDRYYQQCKFMQQLDEDNYNRRLKKELLKQSYIEQQDINNTFRPQISEKAQQLQLREVTQRLCDDSHKRVAQQKYVQQNWQLFSPNCTFKPKCNDNKSIQLDFDQRYQNSLEQSRKSKEMLKIQENRLQMVKEDKKQWQW